VSLLEVSGLTKRFGGVVAVDGCSLSVADGSITALIGPNGSGKTTVFDLITGFQQPDGGEVVFEARPITGLPPDQVHRRGIGRTFQLPRVFPRLTVLENVLVPVRRAGLLGLLSGSTTRGESQRGHEMLELLGLTRLASEPAGRLSYGQRKLLELGTVMMSRPRLVLLDEPAGGVNPGLLEAIGERIRGLNADGATFLIVEHDMGFVMGLCGTVLVLDRGRTIAGGTPAQVRADPAVLDAYLGA
jgi:ABC-type branched-subunit amino acid transport system ATPase component